MANVADKKLTPDALSATSTEDLKKMILALTKGRDGEKSAKKAKLLKQQLMPLFDALSDRNPTASLEDEIPLVQGVWKSVWSTIPFQDIVPGRSLDQSYQVFADNGYYANLARYQFSQKIPFLRWFAKELLNYDLMIIQSYSISDAVEGAQAWDIENVSIRQRFRLRATSFNAPAAKAWFDRAIADHLAKSSDPKKSSEPDIPTAGIDRSTAKRYEGVYKAKPKLEHLYIDRDFRLVKSSREEKQRPSYTIATRLI
ncbi:MAG: hypothetical protein AAF889_09305 [Cyanobacteria bacterium P01_D01_bin.73]